MAELVEIMREQTRARQAWRRPRSTAAACASALGEARIAAALERMATAPGGGATGGARHDAHLGSRPARQRRLAAISTGSGSGDDRPGHRHPAEQHAGRVRPQRRRARGRAGPADEHDGAVDRGGAERAAARSRQRRARCGCAGRSSRWSSTSSAHGMPVEEAIALPRLHVDDQHVHVRGRCRSCRGRRARRRGYDLSSLAAAQPLLRRRGCGRAAARRRAARRRRPSPRRPRRRGLSAS